MAHLLKISEVAANAAADVIGALLDGGSLRIYSVGSGRPANPSVDITDQVLLAELTFGSPAFGAAVAGVLTANAITSDSDANATGTAAWYRAAPPGSPDQGVVDGSVGTTSDFDLTLATTAIVEHGTVPVTTFTLTMPQA